MSTRRGAHVGRQPGTFTHAKKTDLSASRSFVLNTTIVAPHEAPVTHMCFSPAPDSQTTLLVSASRDAHFKAWQLAPPTEGEATPPPAPPSGPVPPLILRSPSLPAADGGPSWSCDFVGAYRGLVPERCCFSADASLLAVSFQEVVTVWSPASWELLTTLSQPPNAIRWEQKPCPCPWGWAGQRWGH